MDKNIVVNPDFKSGLDGWYANSCTAFVSEDYNDLGGRKIEGERCCVVIKRTESWQGLEQELSARLKANVKYNVKANVRISRSFSQSKADVKATLRLESPGFHTKYIVIGSVEASTSKWSNLQGTFCLDSTPEKVTFYIEGPPADVNILIQNVHIFGFQQSMEKQINEAGFSEQGVDLVLKNPHFELGLENWYGKSCNISLVKSMTSEISHQSRGKYFVAATNRRSGWNGIEQEVTGRLMGNKRYQVLATVRIGGDAPSAEVLATLWVKNAAQQEQYITLGKVTASSNSWVQLKGSLLLNRPPEKATAYIEGPPAGVDLLIDSFSIFSIAKPPPVRPVFEDPKFGVNIVDNSNFLSGLSNWQPLGSCSLSIATGAPLILPPAAKESLGVSLPVSGHYIVARNRKHVWEGPSQSITEKIKLYVPYQVSAWVRISHGGIGPQKVNVALGVDNQWVNGGEVEGDPDSWKEVAGSFRFEKKPDSVLLYVQGPSADVDLMVASLQVFAVDRTARFEMLKKQTEKIRKRAVVIQLKNQKGLPIPNGVVQIKQKKNSFPIGSCINQYSLDNDLYIKYFLKTFNWAVFENELKWYWTEKEKGKLNYKDADELCHFCEQHGIPIRGHCILWETEGAIQEWVKGLTRKELAAAVQNRIIDLVSRYEGKFQHYDVNNEMLHGSFYKDRLGSDVWPYMFKMAHQFDPAAKLFVNDYHVEDGCDANSSPEKYVHHIQDLQAMGAPVGGVGLQGHLTSPIGAIIATSLDKLAVVGLPIWFTEIDVSSSNEYLRGADLEVVLREAYAHPAVEGVLLWGFWETAMSREQAHLVEADGTVNEAGKALIALKQEWKSNFEGKTDDKGQFYFNGFLGTYTVLVESPSGVSQKEFEVDKGDELLKINVQI